MIPIKYTQSRSVKIIIIGLLATLLVGSNPIRVSLAQGSLGTQTKPVEASSPNYPTGVTTSSACPLDIYILIDLTGSFEADVATLNEQAPTIVSTILADNPNTRFGLGWFQDYGYDPYGAYTDKPYVRVVDLTFDSMALFTDMAGLAIGYGGDYPESQVPALYQSVTGAGDGIYIPSGQQANFRSEAAKVIVLWTDAPFHRVYGAIPGATPPTYDQAVAALQALSRTQVLGISSDGGGLADLRDITADTGSLAPARGVDCDQDGSVDILAGEPLVCIIAFDGAGITEAFTALVETVVDCRTQLPIILKQP